MLLPFFQYRLQVKGVFSQKGFGFTCMQLAFKNNITGTLFYESSDSVILEITGKEEDVNRLMKECNKADFITEIHILSKTTTANKLNDFIMLNQID